MCCFAPAASPRWETSPSQGWYTPQRQAGLWKFAVVCSLGFRGATNALQSTTVPAGLASVNVRSQFRCNKPWGLRQRKHDPQITEQKSTLKAYLQFSKREGNFRSNDKIHCWKKFHETWNTQAHFKKLFVFYRTTCIKIAAFFKKKKKKNVIFNLFFNLVFSLVLCWWSQQINIHCAPSLLFNKLFLIISSD